MKARERRVHPWVSVAVAALVVAGIALRVWTLASPLGEADADEAVVGLMAADMLDGHFEAFFWDQEYGGVHEAVVVAGLLGLGLPEVAAVKLTPMLFFAAAALLLWRIGRRLAGDDDADDCETAGRLAGALFWAGSAGAVWMSTKERGFYGATLVFGLLVVLLTLRLAEPRRPRERVGGTARDALLLGLAAGGGWHASPQAGYLILPAVGWLAVDAARRRVPAHLLRAVPWVIGGTVLGALPWIVTNLRTGFASLEPPAGFPHSSYADRLDLFFDRGAPMALGARSPVFPPFGLSPGGRALLLVLVAAVVVTVVGLVRRRRRRGGLGRWWIVLTGLAAYPFVFALFPTSVTIADVRYVCLLIPFLALLAGWGLARARPVVAVAGVAALLGGAVVATAETIETSDTPGLWDIGAGDLDPLLAALEREGVERLYADYWIAHRVTYQTGEDVIAAPFDSVRFLPYERAVRGAPAAPYAVFREAANKAILTAYLEANEIAYRQVEAGIYTIYFPAERVLPEQVSLAWAAERVRHGLDLHLET